MANNEVEKNTKLNAIKMYSSSPPRANQFWPVITFSFVKVASIEISFV